MTASAEYHPPVEGIRGLMCGYARPARQKRLLVMLRAFVDDTGSEPAGKVFALVGLVSTAERWTALEAEWVALCAEEPQIADFHMTDIHSLKQHWGRGSRVERAARRDAKLALFADLIRRHAMVRVICAVTWDKYEQIARGNVPAEVDDPYFFLFWRMIQAVAKWQAVTGRREKVNFVFDDQGRRNAKVIGWHYTFLDVMNDDERFILSGTPTFASDKEIVPLQAADMCAWYFRREVIERGGQGPSYVRAAPMAALWDVEYVFDRLDDDLLGSYVMATRKAMNQSHEPQRDEVLKRMLETPPKPHKPKAGAKKPKPSKK
ncbi:MAG: DUF3800 domain-containing protein [Alphaproteobacteria bacterium]|nr:DUF3800 domain-containing protein [Alphaproteobacteria bacterium]